MNLLKTISGLLKPQWQHHDRGIRMSAVSAMSSRDTLILETITLEDPDEAIQVAACKKINDSKPLLNIIKQHNNLKLRNLAQKKYDHLIYDKIIKSTVNEQGGELLQSVQSQRVLADIVINAKYDELQTAAFARIASEEIFYRIAVAGNCPGKLVEATIDAISDPKRLMALTSGKGINKMVRKRAKQRLEELFPPEEDLEFKQQQLNLKLSNMTKYAESVCQSSDNLEGIEKIFKADKERWLTLDPDYSHALAERFLTALDKFAEHYAVVAAKKTAELLEQTKQRKLCEQHEQLLNKLKRIDAQHDNSSELLTELKQQWLELPSSGAGLTTDDLEQQFTQGCKQLETDIKVVRQEKEQLKRLLEDCENAEILLKTAKIETMQQYSAPKWQCKQFKIIDATAELERLKQATIAIQQKIEQFNQVTVAAAKERLDKLEALLHSLQSIINAEDRRQAAKELRSIKVEWQDLKGDQSASLMAQFKKLEAEFKINQQAFIEECKWQEWANKNLKDELIKTVEETAANTNLEQVATIIRSAQKKWKTIGPVPQEISDELWQRFHQACEKNYSRCQELFAQKNQLRLDNLEYCRKLCNRAEQLCEADDLPATAKQFKILQRDWKTHSNLPKVEGDQLYSKFRAFADDFFERLNGYYLKVDSQREANQHKKEQLIAELEQLCEQAVHSPATCIALQKSWRALGPGIRDQEVATNKAFRAGCDRYFALIEAEREQVIPQKEQICQQLELLLAEDNDLSHEQVIAEVIVLQKKWQQLGPLPKKTSDELKNRFQTQCEQLLGIERKNIDGITDLRLENLELKQDLLEQAASLASSTEWKLGAIQLKELQAKWHIIGPVPKANEAELWQKFRAACNQFFKQRKAYFETKDAQRLANLKQKEGLVARLENIIATLDKTADIQRSNLQLSLAEQIQLSVENNFAVTDLNGGELVEEVKRIQQKWKNIGQIPREYDKALWKKYQSLLDCFYQTRKN